MKRSRDFQRLVRYARRHGVGVRFVDHEKMGDHAPGAVAYYAIDQRKIFLSKALRTNFDCIYTLAHEIGHAMDFDGMTKKQFRFNRKAVGAANYVINFRPRIAKKYRLALKQIVLQNEIYAFENGEEVLSLLKIKLPKKKMESDKQDTLRAYRRLFSARRF
jgi:hypothetical protein